MIDKICLSSPPVQLPSRKSAVIIQAFPPDYPQLLPINASRNIIANLLTGVQNWRPNYSHSITDKTVIDCFSQSQYRVWGSYRILPKVQVYEGLFSHG